MIGRLLKPIDFERVLRTRSRLSSVHFALHHLPGSPARLHRPAEASVATELSTSPAAEAPRSVDELPSPAARRPLAKAVTRLWLGMVVPKRHARRSVTRSLLKRQIRHAVAVRQHDLADGIWVLRLRAPFDRSRFPSAASDAMKLAARVELEQLLAAAAAEPGRLPANTRPR